MKGPRPASGAMIGATLRFALSTYPRCDFPPIPTYGGTSDLLPAKPAHLSQVSRGQSSLSDQVGDDGFELVEMTT